MLHIIPTLLEGAVLARIGAGDDVLFLDNAVLGLLKTGRWAGALSVLSERGRLFVLADDVAIRGLAPDELCPCLVRVDYAGFVDLTVKNAVIQSWC
jgi:tRNA 2-thiouridine synthesizing protein B